MPRLASLVLVIWLWVAPSAAAHAVPDSRTDDLATLINRARVEHGLTPLARTPELDLAASNHSLDMVAHEYIDHTGSDGSTPQQRADRAGYHVPDQSAWIVVEVISAVSGDPAGPLDWWLNQSPEVHGKVLLDPRWREMGVGYAAGGEYDNYWTVLVGCRPGVLPTVVVDGETFATTERCGEPPRPRLSATATSAQPGGQLEVRWNAIPSPTPRDWLGLHRTGTPDGTYVAWSYVSCSWMPLTPRGNGWCWFQVPSDVPSGAYDLRLYADDGTERLAASDPIRVGTP